MSHGIVSKYAKKNITFFIWFRGLSSDSCIERCRWQSGALWQLWQLGDVFARNGRRQQNIHWRESTC